MSLHEIKVGPFILWLTGLSGAGKSTLANLTYNYLKSRGKHAKNKRAFLFNWISPQKDDRILECGSSSGVLKRCFGAFSFTIF